MCWMFFGSVNKKQTKNKSKMNEVKKNLMQQCLAVVHTVFTSWAVYALFLCSCHVLLSACHFHVLQSIQLMRTCEATCAVACCPTRLAQHVGKADVWAQGWVHLHPGRHGVKLTVVVELVQEFLSKNNKVWIQHNNRYLMFIQIEMFFVTWI